MLGDANTHTTHTLLWCSRLWLNTWLFSVTRPLYHPCHMQTPGRLSTCSRLLNKHQCVCHVWPSPSAASHYGEHGFQQSTGNIKLNFLKVGSDRPWMLIGSIFFRMLKTFRLFWDRRRAMGLIKLFLVLRESRRNKFLPPKHQETLLNGL